MNIKHEDLKSLLHAATGNIKDFVTDNDLFIYDYMNRIKFREAHKKATALIMRCAMKLPPQSSTPEHYDVWEQSKSLSVYWVEEIIEAIHFSNENADVSFWMLVIAEINNWQVEDEHKAKLDKYNAHTKLL